MLLENERIQEVDINGGDNSWRTQSLNEYFIGFNERAIRFAGNIDV